MRTISKNTNFMYMANTQVVYHCHHFNLFLDQTIDDALGPSDATILKVKVARSTAYQFISNLIQASQVETSMEKLQLAIEYFGAMGHGKLSITGNKDGGEAEGNFLHYSYTWLKKYGGRINRLNSVDAFAAGYSAAALEVAYDLPPGSLFAEETNCKVLKHDNCKIFIKKDAPNTSDYKFVTREQSEESAVTPCVSMFEESIAEIVHGLTEFTADVVGDKERGLVETFGVFVTMQMPSYYNGISYETLRVCKDNQAILEALGELFKESGHVCVFYTLGGVLLSPEWEAMVGKPTGNSRELLISLTAICRAFGFGKWSIKEFVENERFVLESSSTYENCYYSKYCKDFNIASDYLVQGAALAFMVLIHKLDWDEPIDLTPELYDSLFKGDGLGWKVKQTKSLGLGDGITQVVATRIKQVN